MDDVFGHWFAGFFTGEGHVRITSSQTFYTCAAGITARLDDLPLLIEVQRETLTGRIYQRRPVGRSHPCAEWIVTRKEEAQTLVDIFNRYPLRGRKLADFLIWREAVQIWQSMHPVRQPNGRFGGCDWTPIAVLKTTLLEGRQYRTPDLSQLDHPQTAPTPVRA